MTIPTHSCPNPRQSPKCLGTCRSPLCRTCAIIEAGRRKRGIDPCALDPPSTTPSRRKPPTLDAHVATCRERFTAAAASSALRDAIADVLDRTVGIHDGHLVIGDIRVPLGGTTIGTAEWAVWREVVSSHVAKAVGHIFGEAMLHPQYRKPTFKTMCVSDPAEDTFRLMAFKTYYDDEQGNGPYSSIGDKKLRFALALLASAQDVPIVNRWTGTQKRRKCHRAKRHATAPMAVEEET
jgi:hypothetical protein